jgi:hypothetical protein
MALAFYPRSVRLEPLKLIAQIVPELIREQGKQMTHLWCFVDRQKLQLDLLGPWRRGSDFGGMASCHGGSVAWRAAHRGS